MNDEALIIRATEEFLAAWNRGDAKAAAAFYSEDGVRVGAFGDIQHGIPEIEAAYEKLLHQAMPGAKAEQERGTVRMIGDDLAIWQGAMGIILPNGTFLKGHVVQVMKRINNKWLVLEAHPKIFPPRP
jgi:uncharacterized protein (TIGR02246 family)